MTHDNEDFLTALHEAGHAVLAFKFKRGPMKIELFEEDGVTCGRTFSDTGLTPEDVEPGTPKRREEIFQCLICALGGIGVEFLYRGYATGCDVDFNEAITLLRYIQPEAGPWDLDFYIFTVQKFLSDQKSWGAVLALAGVLYEMRQLSGSQARQVIYNSDRVESTPKPVRGKIRLKE